MGEAKGPGYEDKMIDENNWPKWYRGVQQIKDQIARQSRAAGNREVDWYFAEKPVANYFRNYVQSNQRTLPNIHVFYAPPASAQISKAVSAELAGPL